MYENNEEMKAKLKCPPDRVLNTIKIECSVCGEEFEFTPAEQKFYNANGYKFPKRCPACRMKKKSIETITCVDCGKTFTIDGLSKEYFEKRELAIPKRCPECRENKKKRNEQKV